MTDITYITEQDETGLGRIVVDGRSYGVPAKAIAIIKLEAKSLRQQLAELEDDEQKAVERCVIAEQRLAECQEVAASPQAREKVLRDFCQVIADAQVPWSIEDLRDLLARPSGSTALDTLLKQAKLEERLACVQICESVQMQNDIAGWVDHACGAEECVTMLRRMAKELE